MVHAWDAVESFTRLLIAAQLVLRFIKVHKSANEQVELSIVVIVEPDGAGGPAVHCNPGFLRNIGKCAVTIVVIKDASAVLAEEQVWITVAVVVAGCGAHSVAAARDTRLFRDICKGSVSIVSIESVAKRRVGFVEITPAAVDQIDVHPAVIVIIQERATRPRSFREVIAWGPSIHVLPENAADGRRDLLKQCLPTLFEWRKDRVNGPRKPAQGMIAQALAENERSAECL